MALLRGQPERFSQYPSARQFVTSPPIIGNVNVIVCFLHLTLSFVCCFLFIFFLSRMNYYFVCSAASQKACICFCDLESAQDWRTNRELNANKQSTHWTDGTSLAACPWYHWYNILKGRGKNNNKEKDRHHSRQRESHVSQPSEQITIFFLLLFVCTAIPRRARSDTKGVSAAELPCGSNRSAFKSYGPISTHLSKLSIHKPNVAPAEEMKGAKSETGTQKDRERGDEINLKRHFDGEAAF